MNRKVVLIGAGFVGMSMAFSLIDQKGIDELAIIDVNKEKAEGEAFDLSHGQPYASSNIFIHAGTYEDCKDADVIVCTAGLAQKVGQTRIELTEMNTRIMKDIGNNIKKSGFNGVLIIANNPCDIMTYVAYKSSGLPRNQVLGSGTMLDTARLRYMLGEYLQVNYSDINAYIMGEHGDTSFVPWTHAYVGSKNFLEIIEEQDIDFSALLDIYKEVRDAAYYIIERKKATYYGIGRALTKLVMAILNNENTILPVSAYQNNEYGRSGFYIGTPSIVNRNGVREVLKLHLNENEQERFELSCDHIEKIIKEVVDPILSE